MILLSVSGCLTVTTTDRDRPTQNVRTRQTDLSGVPPNFCSDPTDIMGIWDKNLFGHPREAHPLYSGVLPCAASPGTTRTPREDRHDRSEAWMLQCCKHGSAQLMPLPARVSQEPCRSSTMNRLKGLKPSLLISRTPEGPDGFLSLA